MTRYVMEYAAGVIWHVLDAPNMHMACVKTEIELGAADAGRWSEVGSLDAEDEGYHVYEVPEGFVFPRNPDGSESHEFEILDAVQISSATFKREGPAMPWALEMQAVMAWCMNTEDGGEGDLAWRVSRVAGRLSEAVRETTGLRVGDHPHSKFRSDPAMWLPEWMGR